MCLLTPSFGKQLKYHLGRCLSILFRVAISVMRPYLTDGRACVVRLYHTSPGCRVLDWILVAQCKPLFAMCSIIAELLSFGAIQIPSTLEGVEGSRSLMGIGWLSGWGIFTSYDACSPLGRRVAVQLVNLYDKRYQ